MTAMQCSCGFTELADEEITDHLLLAFEPPDLRGNDGLVHAEGKLLTCLCGLTAPTAGELDQHFLQAFTPQHAIGQDGQRHQASHLNAPEGVPAS
jgi:hypothetical protein